MSKYKASTLADVAKEAGVSVTTASLALSGSGRISEKTICNIKKAADSLGYKKKNYVKIPKPTNFTNICLLFDFSEKWSFVWNYQRKIIESLQRTITANGYDMIVMFVNDDMDENEILNRILQSKSGAVISLLYGNKQLFDKLEATDIPVVLLLNDDYQDRYYTVTVDHYQSSFEGTNYLIKLGHKKILFIDCERPNMPLEYNDRFVGFKRAIHENNISFSDSDRIALKPEYIHVFENKLKVAFQQPQKPTALFCIDDDIAVKVMSYVKNIGIKIPEDVSIIATGDILDYDTVYTPPITTLKIDTVYLGKLAAELLINRINNKPDHLHVIKIKQQLVTRATCRPLPATTF